MLVTIYYGDHSCVEALIQSLSEYFLYSETVHLNR